MTGWGFGGAAPKFWTRPTPGALHDGAAIARLAVALRRPLMPWQLFVMRVATERRLDDVRRFRYREVRVTVPRQSGKTTGAHAKNVHRCVQGRPVFGADGQVLDRDPVGVFYTAQTGKDARERWLDAVGLVEKSPLKRFVTDGNDYGGAIRRGAGASAILWPNGSQLRPFAPTAASLHGYTPDTVDEDEVWAYDEIQGEALDGAIGPAQITLAHAQRWRYSTMGDADSTYWHRLVADGRAATEDPDADVAYFEWSADPARDLYDPAHWADFHPAVGFTIDARDLAAEAARQPEGVWRRAYCNLQTAARETIVSLDVWDDRGQPDVKIQAKGAALAFDVAHDQSQATITIARPHGEDGVLLRVVRSAPGVAWLADELVKLATAWKLREIHADDWGAAREITDELRRRGWTVKTTDGGQFAAASSAILRRARDGRLIHDGSAVLHDALAAAKLRPVGDGVALSRRQSGGPIDALTSGAVAVRAALLTPPPAPPPLIVTGAE